MKDDNDQSGAAQQPPRSEPSKERAQGATTPEADLQPEDTGSNASANQGSPVAPVMKQFQKTRAEGSGRP